MLTKISETFHAWAKGRWVILMFLADLLMMGYIMPVAGWTLTGGIGESGNKPVSKTNLVSFP